MNRNGIKMRNWREYAHLKYWGALPRMYLGQNAFEERGEMWVLRLWFCQQNSVSLSCGIHEEDDGPHTKEEW